MAIKEITQADINAYNETKKTRKVETELGTDVVRIIIETIVPMIQDDSITNKTPDEVIAQAKANRLAEL